MIIMNSITNRLSSYNTLGFALASLLFAANTSAAIIQNSNPDTLADAFNGDCGVPGELTACVGGWNLDNVDVILKTVDGIDYGSFDKETGTYSLMTYGDYFESLVRGDENQILARITGKTWPVGEPNAIKIVVDDSKVSNGKPQNCIIGTAFLSPEKSDIDDANFLDSTHPRPVICSSSFQTHKRFKVAMLPDAVEGIADGEGHGIDLVFNVKNDSSGELRAYQVFSKINNYTGKRLGGYKLVIGVGEGSAFQSASALGIADRLHFSLGRGEGASDGGAKAIPDGSDLFDFDSLATFSHGLFGSPDKHFTENGFFDNRTAGYNVEQGCASSDSSQCPTYDNPDFTNTLEASDTIYSTSPLDSNYHQLPGPTEGLPFGEWLPSIWEPRGVFYDDDNDPETDASLIAWWDGSNWRGKYDEGFPVFSQDEINWFAANPDGLYELGEIEDVLNLGINYIIKVGDGIPNAETAEGGTFTVRIIPMVSTNQTPPAWCSFGVCNEPQYGDTSSSGGCSVSKEGRLDPSLVVLFFIALAHTWRRRQTQR